MTPIPALLTFALLAAPGVVNDVTYTEYYVSASTGSDATGEGTMVSPWASIGHSLASITASEVNPATLHIAAGLYRESLQLAPFVELSGGYDPVGWQRDPSERDTKVRRLQTAVDAVLDGLVLTFPETAGLVCTGGARVSVKDCRLEDNYTTVTGDGGGFRVHDGASLRVEACVVTGNGPGPPVLFGTTKGGAVLHDSTGTVELIGCTIRGNSAALGGGIYAERGSIVCRDCVFTHNSASWGASIHTKQDASATLINCRFTDNTVFEFGWVETYDLYGERGNWTMINCILANVRGTSETASAGGTIRNCILRGPNVRVGGVSYSNVENYSGGVGNIDVEPGFVNAAEEDYRLLLSSPCIDMGTDFEAPDHDLDGNPRPVDIPGQGFDGPGQGYDMGCYEYVPPSPTPTPTPRPEDLNRDGKIDALDLYIFSQYWQRGAATE